ncbi:MAG: cystathionine beta-synthase [Thaumarchaeota archaeon]|nr:cystathionine beta-synthase [Nitrososphaerota archaeon]
MPPRIAESIVDLIGGTPLVRLNRMTKGLRPRVYAKLEFFNPGGSIKDRIGLAMILDAERKGIIKPGYTIVEPTSGNTGMGLAMAAVLRGYKIVFTVPDKMSKDKIDLLRAFGAKVRVTPSKVPPDHPASYVQVAKRIASETPKSFIPNQYENQANPDAHYRTTGPEVWEQTEGKVDVLVAGVGTGGTITGTGRYLKERNPGMRIVAADPEGSILADVFEGRKGTARPYKVEGIGEDFVPATLDMKVIDEFVKVSDRDAFLTARRLAKEEGIFAGGSSGAAVFAALQVSKRMKKGETVVVILPDTGRSYINKVYNDDWMAEEGFIRARGNRISVNDILESKPKDLRLVISAGPDDPLSDAISKLTQYDISQLPVIQDGVQVGSIVVSSVIERIGAGGASLEDRVEDVMEAPLPTVDWRSKMLDPGKLLKQKNALVVVDGPLVVGVLTPIDVINYIANG